MPMVSVKIKNVLGGAPYPEVEVEYRIVGSSGVVVEVRFEGRGVLSGGRKRREGRSGDHFSFERWRGMRCFSGW